MASRSAALAADLSVGPTEEQDQESPMISPRASRTFEPSSGDVCARRRPIRSTANVRIWLILIQERLGRPRALLSSVSGNPARGSWLVRATAITVPDRSLNTSWLRMSTGRSPACSRPRTGLRSAQRPLLSVFGPSLSTRCQPFLGQRSLLISVQLRTFARQATLRQACELLGNSGFHCLASIREAVLGYKLVQFAHQCGIEGDR